MKKFPKNYPAKGDKSRQEAISFVGFFRGNCSDGFFGSDGANGLRFRRRLPVVLASDDARYVGLHGSHGETIANSFAVESSCFSNEGRDGGQSLSERRVSRYRSVIKPPSPRPSPPRRGRTRAASLKCLDIAVAVPVLGMPTNVGNRRRTYFPCTGIGECGPGSLARIETAAERSSAWGHFAAGRFGAQLGFGFEPVLGVAVFGTAFADVDLKSARGDLFLGWFGCRRGGGRAAVSATFGFGINGLHFRWRDCPSRKTNYEGWFGAQTMGCFAR